MNRSLRRAFGTLVFLSSCHHVLAAPAVEVLGKDFTFPERIEGFPAKLSDFKGLQINSFMTNDGVRLSYWEAGKGKPLVFIPGWSANGAEYFNVMYQLSKHYHVYVLDPRNQGLSQHVDYGTRISRFAVDLKEFNEKVGIKKAYYSGWSMGASVLWSYIDLYGTTGIEKLVLIDEPPSIYSHADWSEQERLDAGAFVSDPERMVEGFTAMKPLNSLIAHSKVVERASLMDSPYYKNSESLAQAFINNDPTYLKLVLFDHVTNDWRDVIQKKIDVPTAIFTGCYSDSLQGQRWIHSVVPNSELYVYSQEEQGDHFLAFKNPIKFTADLRTFLER
ncbi:pimeloyl-ACP methyl ester carboxylesterase [Pseudomonas duriflava]|uniref:Pimeloyl-ACP methyl ester carboxylesterase n=2 Tax=Pseudomonas duriflava TaxID=459528 RepID=A0A562PJL2_9PSED|nr:pimeloyl-ACP methyl ester carboxylesterase [Pseudomonas duriflava]